MVAFDCRGHGKSGKPHDIEDYDEDPDDGRCVGGNGRGRRTPRADVMGYSMGGYIALNRPTKRPRAFARVLLGGIGGKYFQLLGEPLGRRCRRRSRHPKAPVRRSHWRACSAIRRKGRERPCGAFRLHAARPAHLFVQGVGTRSASRRWWCAAKPTTSAARPSDIAKCFARGRAVVVPERDHMATVGDRHYKRAVAEFLAA